jgi:hypothetical protein
MLFIKVNTSAKTNSPKLRAFIHLPLRTKLLKKRARLPNERLVKKKTRKLMVISYMCMCKRVSKCLYKYVGEGEGGVSYRSNAPSV